MSDEQAEADFATWLEYFRLALEGTAAISSEMASTLVSRADAIGKAAVARLKVRRGEVGTSTP
jgi:hypothetical protein